MCGRAGRIVIFLAVVRDFVFPSFASFASLGDECGIFEKVDRWREWVPLGVLFGGLYCSGCACVGVG